MFAKLEQKWNAFKANLGEYQRLRRIATAAWHKLEQMRVKITTCQDIAKKSCIKIKWTYVKTNSAESCSNGTISVMSYDDFCPLFRAKDDAESPRPCIDKKCSCYNDSLEYIKASQEYSDAVKCRRGFWNILKTNKK
ncbi:hypothetical protein HDR61_04615 [bacterium]|nr:hypothetical protein [bacterium]